jgi:hypothetical protein
VYYTQVYAYYEEVEAPASYILAGADGFPVRAVEVQGFRGIDAGSSPIRYRACFDGPALPLERIDDVPRLEDPRPPVAPEWFDCFDARAIGEALEAGEAEAFLSIPNFPTYGIDEVVALFPDGRAFAWRQINACGERVFDGEPPPEGCPPLPESE